MKHCIQILILASCVACSPFKENRIGNHEEVLLSIITEIEDCGNARLEVDSDDRIASLMRKNKIDYIHKNLGQQNIYYSGFPEAADSLIIFAKRSPSILIPEKRIIYDFAKIPKNIKDQSIKNAGYSITKVDDRWYFVEVKFD